MISPGDVANTDPPKQQDFTMALNRQRLDALVEYFGNAQTAEMIVKVVDGLATHTQALRRAEPATLSRLGHEIKGIASMYGLDAVAAAALAIELGTAETNRPGAVVELDRLIAEARRELAAFACELTAAN